MPAPSLHIHGTLLILALVGPSTERKRQTERGLVVQEPCSLPDNALQLGCSQVPAVSLDGSPAGMLLSRPTLCGRREQGPESKACCSEPDLLLP